MTLHVVEITLRESARRYNGVKDKMRLPQPQISDITIWEDAGVDCSCKLRAALATWTQGHWGYQFLAKRTNNCMHIQRSIAYALFHFRFACPCSISMVIHIIILPLPALVLPYICISWIRFRILLNSSLLPLLSMST
jgi:hypothetical protein